jgi:hypothetical protein
MITSPVIPVSGNHDITTIHEIGTRGSYLLSIEEFIQSLVNGNQNHVVGIYVPENFAQSVATQPASNPAFVSSKSDVLTQFSTATKYGSLGFIAHNYLSGDLFFDLSIGDTVIVIFGDGQTQSYRIFNIRHFQALSPNSPYSDFKNLDSANGKILSAEQLFFATYGREDQLVFQTCIEKDGNSTWGRLFVLAIPISQIVSSRQVEGVLGSN